MPLFWIVLATWLYVIAISFLGRGLPWDVALSRLHFDASCTAQNARDCWLFSKADSSLTFWLHTVPSQSVVVIGILCVMAIIVAFYKDRPLLMRTAVAIFLGIAVTPALVTILKKFTGHYCPGQLPLFHGSHKADSLPRCFPASHPSPYFGLIALYFTSLPLAWRHGGLIAGLVLGTLVSWIQIARGEHYLSHDIATLATALYVGLWACLIDRELKKYHAVAAR